MINDIIELQDLNNIHTIGIDWISKGVAWDFTIFTETAELVDSLGLKWWKNCDKNIGTNTYKDVLDTTEFDLDNVKIELVDLLHFIISKALVEYNGDRILVASAFNEQQENMYMFDSISEQKLTILSRALRFSNSMTIEDYVKLANVCGFELQELYELYIKKNALNKFRQDNGYKEGTYSKLWDGKEDNTYLHNISGELTVSKVYDILDSIYKEKVKK